MIKKIANKIGVDKAIAFTVAARVFQGFGGIISVLLVATCLSGVEQGFYYTFASILAIQVFFELGLSGIITQFVAHEKAQLTECDGDLIGDEKYRSRLAHLLLFCVKWYGILAIGILVIISIIGYIFFSHFYPTVDSDVSWKIPWVLLVIGTSINFIISPLSAYIEGLGKVKEIAKIRLIQQIAYSVLTWGGLLAGLHLYVAAMAPFAMIIVFSIYGWRLFGKQLIYIAKQKITEKISYRNEIFPYQWRIALSWISGYFIFQLFNPVLFAIDGPVVAGQMGMTLNILNAIQALSLSWITTKVPKMSSLIALQSYAELDNLFNRTLKQMLIIIAFMLVVFVVGVHGLQYFSIKLKDVLISDRLLPIVPMIFMTVALFVNQYIGAIATYLRCHKKEPFLINSIIGGVLCMLSTLILGNLYGVMGITIGYCAITIILLPLGHYIYITKKKQWHQS